MAYLLTGEDRGAKDKQIAELKGQYLKNGDALKMDYAHLHGAKLDPATLKKTLLALPALSDKRLVLIRGVEKLNPQNKDIILDFLGSENSHAVLVLDTDEAPAKNSFFNKLNATVKVLRFGQGSSKKNVFDMTRAIERHDPSTALKVLDQLIGDGEHPLKIMGGLVWFWGSNKRRLSGDGFKKGLLVLQEADLNIKRSRIDPQYAVEIAVTKLGSIMSW